MPNYLNEVPSGSELDSWLEEQNKIPPASHLATSISIAGIALCAWGLTRTASAFANSWKKIFHKTNCGI